MSRLLLDTNVLLWTLDDVDRLSAEVVDQVTDGANDVAVSVASIWEIAIKTSLGKLRVDGDLRERVRVQDFAELPVLGPHAVEVGTLPWHHRDPFDRLLVAQARREGYTLVTADRQLSAYDVPILPAFGGP